MNLCFIENFCRSSDSEVLWFPLRGRTLAPEITIPPGGCSRETRQTRVTAVGTIILQGDTACSTLLRIFRLRLRPSCTLNTETASTSSAWLLAVLLICRYNISIYHTTSNMLQLLHLLQRDHVIYQLCAGGWWRVFPGEVTLGLTKLPHLPRGTLPHCRGAAPDQTQYFVRWSQFATPPHCHTRHCAVDTSLSHFHFTHNLLTIVQAVNKCEMTLEIVHALKEINVILHRIGWKWKVRETLCISKPGIRWLV